mmetsp:Transcript_26594/g.61091  ORF Transcript_26594/g.61091 Transcript_26594/m.61091 type:complete len:213 (+) Transcript_26594:63-701(+)
MRVASRHLMAQLAEASQLSWFIRYVLRVEGMNTHSGVTTSSYSKPGEHVVEAIHREVLQWHLIRDRCVFRCPGFQARGYLRQILNLGDLLTVKFHGLRCKLLIHIVASIDNEPRARKELVHELDICLVMPDLFEASDVGLTGFAGVQSCPHKRLQVAQHLLCRKWRLFLPRTMQVAVLGQTSTSNCHAHPPKEVSSGSHDTIVLATKGISRN